MKPSLSTIFALFAASIILACGGSDGGSSGPSGSSGAGNAGSPPNTDDSSGNCSIPTGSSASDACVSCVKDSCGSQYADFCSGKCGANAATSTCQNAATEIGQCVIQNCDAECDTGDDSPGDAAGSGNSSSGGAGNSAGAGHSAGASQGSGGAGTPTTPNCVKLEACCGTLPGDSVQGPCFQSAGFNNDGPCLNLLKAYQNAGQCGDDAGNETVACTVDDECTKQTYPKATAETLKGACEASNGTVSDACPSKDVKGCCTISGVEVCSYSDDGISEDDCAQTGGKYSATP